MKKNVGTRTKPATYTPEQRRERRAKQAARAILAGVAHRTMGVGGSRWHANWDRIERHLRDIPERAEFMDLDIPAGTIARCWPAPPASEPAAA